MSDETERGPYTGDLMRERERMRATMSDVIPSAEENPHGLHRRYVVTKADGSPCDPNAIYLVLRLDSGGKDQEHIAACRVSARKYADEAPGRLSKMTHELRRLLDRLEGSVR